jgi:hypothetical protein
VSETQQARFQECNLEADGPDRRGAGDKSAEMAPLRRGLRAIWKCRWTWIHCAVWFYLMSRPGTAFMGFVPALVYLFWMPASLLIIWLRPERRLRQATRLALWTLTFVAVAGLATYRTDRSRAYAEVAAAALERYRSERGTYPPTLQDAGVPYGDEERLRWLVSYYGVERPDQVPMLMYRSQWDLFDKCFYDFPTHEWKCYVD